MTFRSFLFASSLVLVALPAVSDQALDPANFTTAVTNPWLPLTPGTVMNYSGNLVGSPAGLTVTVTDKTRKIAGVECLVVEELVSQGGRPTDRTIAYYAQDRAGNVWYFGEDVQELAENGDVAKVEGWKTGIDGAIPSLVMEAIPVQGHALVNTYTNDHAEVVSLSKPVKTPSGTYPDALQTKEWTPDEPNVLANKYYVQGIGMVREVVVQGDPEEFVLTEVLK